MQDQMEGFGEAAKQYLDFLKQHEDSIRILQYGYCLKQEAFSEQVVTDTVEAVLELGHEMVVHQRRAERLQRPGGRPDDLRVLHGVPEIELSRVCWHVL